MQIGTRTKLAWFRRFWRIRCLVNILFGNNARCRKCRRPQTSGNQPDIKKYYLINNRAKKRLHKAVVTSLYKYARLVCVSWERTARAFPLAIYARTYANYECPTLRSYSMIWGPNRLGQWINSRRECPGYLKVVNYCKRPQNTTCGYRYGNKYYTFQMQWYE